MDSCDHLFGSSKSARTVASAGYERQAIIDFRSGRLKGDALIDAVLSHLDVVSPDFPSLQEFADHYCTSVRTLGRRLKLAGTSYRALVNSFKAEQAKVGLSQSTVPINDIALSLGYRDPSNFSAAFKSMTGLTPSQYRQYSLREGMV